MAKPVILETDWYSDCDDVMAARVACVLHHKGVIQLLGVSVNASFPNSAQSLDAFLRQEGLDIPIAIVQDWTECCERETYQKALSVYPSVIKSNSEAEDPVAMYRRLLATSTEKVDVISIGFAENLSRLLSSAPDGFSPLTGRELVKEKVGELWMMAGRWDVPVGEEYNLRGNDGSNALITRSGSHVLKDWPTPITFLGFEIGVSVKTGGDILPEGDPLKVAMVAHGSAHGRSSWDPMTVLLAAKGSPDAAGYDDVRGYASSSPDKGENTFRQDENGPHRYIIKRHPDEYYAEAVNQLLLKH